MIVTNRSAMTLVFVGTTPNERIEIGMMVSTSEYPTNPYHHPTDSEFFHIFQKSFPFILITYLAIQNSRRETILRDTSPFQSIQWDKRAF
jgi:hypothetical protein